MYSVEEFLKKKSSKISDFNILDEKQLYSNIEELQQFDKMKSKVLKYALYKKRTEQEIRQKFSKELEEKMLDDIIEVLKENSYINDYAYVKKAINEYMNLKNLSIKEMKYKLYSKGIKGDLIDEYISNNIDELESYEKKSAQSLLSKKMNSMDENEMKFYLLKKGYSDDIIKKLMKENY